jgi:peptidoglycan/LPS O-acetylase OafA/YrhL
MKPDSDPTSSREESAAIRFIPELDGLRGIAISLVLLFHLHVPLFRIGWCGVDLFFVLSGFLITSILLATKGSAHYFRTFYARRFLRIFPLYYATLFLVFCVALPIAAHLCIAKPVSISEQLWYWLYISNWWNALGHSVYYLSHFWTLAVEEQFYLFWPMVVFLLSRRSLATFSVATIVGCLVMRTALCWNSSYIELIHRGTFFRMDDLAWGGLLALAATDERLAGRLKSILPTGAAIGLAVLIAVLVSVGPVGLSLPMITIGYTGLGVVSAYLVWKATNSSGDSKTFTRVLLARPLRELGKYSYGIYVLHYPIVIVLELVRGRLAARSPRAEEMGVFLVAGTVLAFAASYLVALISWNVLEKRVLQWKKHFPYTAGTVPSPEVFGAQPAGAGLNSLPSSNATP